MKTLLASATEKPTERQKKDCACVVTDATEESVRALLDKLDDARILTKANMQQVHAAGDRIAACVVKTVEAEIDTIVSRKVGCLKRIYADREFEVGPTDGTKTLASASDLFLRDNIDANFKNWGCDKPGKPTKPQKAEVYEIFEDTRYGKIFGGFGLNPDQLCWGTPEIKSWLAKYAGTTLCGDGAATFLFLFKVEPEKKKEEKNKFFVADVLWRVGYHRRFAYVHRFSDEDVWHTVHRFRVVVPQQALVK